VSLAHRDEERVQLVEERGIRRQVRFEKGARGLIARVRGDQPMPREHAPRVGVGDEDRAVRGIEEDGVGGLGTHPRHREQLGTQGPERRAPQAAKPSVEPMEEPARELTKPPCLQLVRAGAPNDRGQLCFRHGHEPLGIEQPPRAQRGDGERSIRPRGVLREHRADGDLVRAAARPPALPPEAAQEGDVKAQDPGFDGIAGWSGDPAPSREDG
jgi:hypothetical protein